MSRALRTQPSAPAPVGPDAALAACAGTPEGPARETLASAARRHGLSTTRVSEILTEAGVYQRVGSNRGKGGLRLPVADVDRAMAAHRRAMERPSAPADEPPKPAPVPDAHVPDAEGNVACESCWSIAFLTRGRITACRWCRGTARW